MLLAARLPRAPAALGAAPRRTAPRPRRSAAPPMASFLSRLFGGGGDAAAAPPAGATRDASGRLISASGHDVTPLSVEARAAAARSLSPLSRDVTLMHGTERAFTGATVDGTRHDSKAKGVYGACPRHGYRSLRLEACALTQAPRSLRCHSLCLGRPTAVLVRR
jgi:hypothetical protein